ncbi:uncharacterized protein LOC107492987 isoform X1 [Arachis duranensis]|uniref:Uncharacterized protein LOC107492987 isoform X1 n=1 Tax=Arachis duranensis TaxID=130453 RepID=A0A6P4DK03_ARADU|nr:uncharacterized protein LOC107492987 isoform X1 [Arachis duranensis]XP_057722629.1 uncharacterized protein LOC130936560 isoform X1 [Arachis stenosperma]
MGRKPSASKNSSIDKVPIAMFSLKHGNPSLERVVPQPFTGNITSPGPVDPNSNCMRSPLRCPNPPVDGAVMHNARTPVQQQVNQPWLSYTKKKSKSHSSYVRRSERIKSAVVHTDKKIRGIQYIEDGDSEKDEPDAQMEQVLSELGPQVQPEPEPEHEPEPDPEPAAENSYLKSLDEKVESILRRIEALENLKFKVDGNAGPYEAPSATTNDYLSLYIESQKKVESLTAKLENALGKVEVYEKENQVLTDVLDKMKDAINASMVSNLSKATEAAVNASSQAIRTACSAKRKRDAQET